MPDLPINGFAGNAAVMTTWGTCRLHDLARLTASRNLAAQQWQSRVAELAAHNAATLADFNEHVAPTLNPAAANTQRDALFAAQAAQLLGLQQAHDADMALRLPLLVIDDETTAECVGVELVGETVNVVDVTIAELQVGDPPQAVPVTVRCGTAAVFVAANGDIAAMSVDGETIELQPTDTFVAAASAMQLNEPIGLYRILSNVDMCCIGSDSTVAARVRCVVA